MNLDTRPIECALSLSGYWFLHTSLAKRDNNQQRTSQRTISPTALIPLRSHPDRGEHLRCPDFSWLYTFTGSLIRAYSRSVKIVCQIERHAGPRISLRRAESGPFFQQFAIQRPLSERTERRPVLFHRHFQTVRVAGTCKEHPEPSRW